MPMTCRLVQVWQPFPFTLKKRVQRCIREEDRMKKKMIAAIKRIVDPHVISWADSKFSQPHCLFTRLQDNTLVISGNSETYDNVRRYKLPFADCCGFTADGFIHGLIAMELAVTEYSRLGVRELYQLWQFVEKIRFKKVCVDYAASAKKCRRNEPVTVNLE